MSDWYPLVILWTYLAAFFLGLGLIFVMPQGTLLLLFLGLGGMGFAVIGSKLLHWFLRIVARKSLHAQRCPICESSVQTVSETQSLDESYAIVPFWECTGCGAKFERNGEEIRREPRIIGNSHQDAVIL